MDQESESVLGAAMTGPHCEKGKWTELQMTDPSVGYFNAPISDAPIAT